MDSKNTEAIHALGNGRLLVYEKGSEILSVYPGDYSAPSAISIDSPDGRMDCPSERSPHGGVWSHCISTPDGKIRFSDLVDPDCNVFLRGVRSDCAGVLRLRHSSSVHLYRTPEYDAVAIVPKGTLYFTQLATSSEYRVYIQCGGCISFDLSLKQFRIMPGEGFLKLTAMKVDEDPQGEELARCRNIADSEERCELFWNAFFRRIHPRFPENRVLDDALESVAYAIKVQQSRDGGVAAGHFYPMAYVRDQAGVARGLLSLGLNDMAEAIVEFWYRKFSRYGSLHNAETMGNDDGRLVFSNDEVEVPAYVMLTAFACREAGHADRTWLDGMRDMLHHCAEVQLRHLAHGMTGFSGDETYVAGGMFPRSWLYHGSAESTMLFILSAEKYMDCFGPEPALKQGLEEAKRLYRENFVINGRLYANCPDREKYAESPRFHFGFCDTCLLMNRPAPLTWLERGPDRLYRCPECIDADRRPAGPEPEAVLLSSISLSAAWHGFDRLDPEEEAATAEAYLEIYRKRGGMYASYESDITTGYDYALLLQELTHLNHPAVPEILTHTLERLDETGTWSEYYRHGVPYNCRFRPWESAVNISACINAAQKLYGKR